MIKLFSKLLTIILFSLFVSCSDDDNEVKQNNDFFKFPITLTTKEKKDELIFFKNGAIINPDISEEEFFSNIIKETLDEQDEALSKTSFKFISESLFVSDAFNENKEKVTFEYLFKDGLLKIIDSKGVEVSLAEGSNDQIILRLIITYSNIYPIGVLRSIFGVSTKDLLPLNFESTKELHDFENLEDITGDSSLYIFKREYIFEK
jgi:hypothetical protein|tara:strand:- start:236 stop:850 length:615 start_codon:yes stop_codon:yes gene_type:complete